MSIRSSDRDVFNISGNAWVNTQERCLSILRENLLASEIVLAIHAAEGLTEFGLGEEVCSVLLPRFQRESNERTRCLLARELVRAGDYDKLNILTRTLVQPDEMLQRDAAESLFKIRQVGDEALVRRVFANTNNPILKLFICAGFVCQGDYERLKPIRESLSSSFETLRKIAAWILTRLGTDSDITILQELRALEQDTVTRAYFDHALAALNDVAGIRSFKQNLFSSCTEIRRMAAETARLLISATDLKSMLGLLDDNDPDVRIRTAHALLYSTTFS